MLKFEDFEPVDRNIVPFKFQHLQMVIASPAAQAMYSDDKSNRFSFIQFDSFDELSAIDFLGRIGILQNYKGSLKKDGKMYAFYIVGEHMNLGAYA